MELSFTTGITALDELLDGVEPGDNLVYQVDKITEYIPFVHSFCTDAIKNERELIYFRFGKHKPFLKEEINAKVFEIDPSIGFEYFINKVFKCIKKFGRGACYVFDSLSDLAEYWYSDRMLANFFMLTCPYLYDFDTATYFVHLRNQHSQYTINKIRETAQVILDVYTKDKRIYVHPLKVWKRYSPTMYMLHVLKNGKFVPVTQSIEISEVLSQHAQPWVDFTTRTQDVWSKTYYKAQRKLNEYNQDGCTLDDLRPLIDFIISMNITRDKKLKRMVQENFSLDELIRIGKRMIGTGLIGGKSVGMLLAQAIVKNKDEKWDNKLEIHDSFFIGSDVFYTYLVINKCWWKRYEIKFSEKYLDIARETQELLSKGVFPDDIIEQFKNVLEYFGQSPIIVRSSSLLEDAYGNSFSGKYDSIFLANQGTPEERLDKFIKAVRDVYKSSLSEDAITYRARRNLLGQEEQMAILVQRVSGAIYGKYFYPHLAGVGYSFNPYVWAEDIDPEAGLIRLVFGLGTRAVDKIDDDYTRIVALNAPNRRPESNIDDKMRYQQRKVDVLDLDSNTFITDYFDEIVENSEDLQIELFGERDWDIEKRYEKLGKKKKFYRLDLDKMLLNSELTHDMQKIIEILETEYNYPIDMEFTVNFKNKNDYKINILQCRPFQVKKGSQTEKKPKKIDKEDIIIKSTGPIVGYGVVKTVDLIIFVSTEHYSRLSMQDRYGVARLIGKITSNLPKNVYENILLIGPGRWATSSPSLGVPVKFHEISRVSVICELAEMHEQLRPDVSLGTHFFNDLVEQSMLYLAVYPTKPTTILKKRILQSMDNSLSKYVKSDIKFQDVVRVIETAKLISGKVVKICAD
ncbi:MAG: pyruvate, phosphate dikinase, partial [Candidatus Lokiarchaeota archaeon]|nr:pyruvate, phosphate dikinase [Candidatus Lokiarchaeota archaeon]